MSHHRCCCGQVEPGESFWIQVVMCGCNFVAWSFIDTDTYSCGTPPPVGSVLRYRDDGLGDQVYPGTCWEVVDVSAEPPIPEDDPEFYRLPLIAGVNWEFQCASGCGDANCADPSGYCPPCDWQICNGWQDDNASACGYITKTAYIRRLVAMVFAEQSLTFQSRFINLGFYANHPIGTVLTGVDATITYRAFQYTKWDWVSGAPQFVNQTLMLAARMQYALYGPFTGEGCSFDRTIQVAATNSMEGQWYDTPCGQLPPILSEPIQCGDEPTRLAYFPHGIVDPFSQCPEYLSCVSPSVASIFTNWAYVDNQLPDDGTCLQEVAVVNQHENTIGGNGCGLILDRDVTDTRYFRPWIFTRTRRNWNETSDEYSACSTGGPRLREYHHVQYNGSISGRGWWYGCTQDLPGLVVTPPPAIDPSIEAYMNQDPMRRCRGCGG